MKYLFYSIAMVVGGVVSIVLKEAWLVFVIAALIVGVELARLVQIHLMDD